jgi:hydroxyacylglutathione hydrolase
MIFKRFYDESLAQASYLIGCEKTREAIVVDPGLALDEYERAAAAERLRITHVAETHIHADFVSGSRALADKVGAILHLSSEGAGQWGYTEKAMEGAIPLADGGEIVLGDVIVEGAHTPGHTPEHMTLIVTDHKRGTTPVGAVTGDFIFVGDVGRPDLLERAVGAAGNAQQSASELYRSVQSFKSRPDHLQLWPGHGAGSVCGKSLGSVPQTTLGYERLFNWAFGDLDERQFVARALDHQPVPPRYFAEMKKLNRDATKLPPFVEIPGTGADGLSAALERGATVVDTRTAAQFAEKHIARTVNVPLGKSFLTWMGALVPYDLDLYLIVDGDASAASSVVKDLRKIGLVRVAGVAEADVVDVWTARQTKPRQLPHLDAQALDSRVRDGNVQIIDVRSPEEWSSGHLPGAVHMPLAALPDRVSELDPTRQIVVHCQGGGRSAIAASYIKSKGLDGVANLEGGFDAWRALDLPVEQES